MGLIAHYFTVPSDAEAAALIDTGPARLPGSGWLADGVDGRGIDPVVQLGQLETILSGASFESVLKGSGREVSARDGGETLVWRLNDTLTDALLERSLDDLVEASDRWAGVEEFHGGVDPDDLTEFLFLLRGLATAARERDQKVYCWMSV